MTTSCESTSIEPTLTVQTESNTDNLKNHQKTSTTLAKMPPPLDIIHVVNYDLPKPTWMIEDLLRDDTYVGQLFGPPKTGKSFMVQEISCCLACGKSYGPFKIERAWRVVYINVEDPATQTHIRIKNIITTIGFNPDEVGLIAKNLKMLNWQGKFGPINGPNSKDHEHILLHEIIESFQPDLIIGDTKSRLSYGSENSNSKQADLVRTLEEFLTQFGGPFLMVHHSTKSNDSTDRGASAWGSNIRLSMNLKKLDKGREVEYGLSKEEADDRAFEMISHDNYGAKFRAVFYKDPETGVPLPISPKYIVGDRVKDWLREALQEHGPVNKRNLTGNHQGEDEKVAAIMESYPDVYGDKRKLIPAAVKSLLEEGKIHIVMDGQKKLLALSVVDSMAEAVTEAEPKPLKRRRRRIFKQKARKEPELEVQKRT